MKLQLSCLSSHFKGQNNNIEKSDLTGEEEKKKHLQGRLTLKATLKKNVSVGK